MIDVKGISINTEILIPDDDTLMDICLTSEEDRERETEQRETWAIAIEDAIKETSKRIWGCEIAVDVSISSKSVDKLS